MFGEVIEGNRDGAIVVVVVVDDDGINVLEEWNVEW